MIKSAQECRKILSLMILKESNPYLRESYSQSRDAWLKRLNKLEKNHSLAYRWEIEERIAKRKSNKLRRDR